MLAKLCMFRPDCPILSRRARAADPRAEGNVMALQSESFRGDPKLEAAAVSNPAHILKTQPPSTGIHVSKIQRALMQLDGAQIDKNELDLGSYDNSTANAVLRY